MLYRYQAINGVGKSCAGTLEAGTPVEARTSLREQGILAFKVEPVMPSTAAGGKTAPSGRVSWLSLSGRRLELLNTFTRHLALLLKTGLPLAQALVVLSDQAEDRQFRDVLKDVATRVKEGAALDAALGVHPAFFPELYLHVAKAGATAGELPKVLTELAAYYDRQKRLRDRVVSALTYPALMCSVGVLVLVFLMVFVVPKVTEVLLEEKRVLPWPTEVLLFVSGLFSNWWWAMLAGLGVMAFGMREITATATGRRLLDRLSLGLPFLGDLFRKQAVARWAGTMSTLLTSGIPVAQALAVVRGTVGNAVLADDVRRVEEEILGGSSLSEAVKRSKILPPSIGFVAGVGEESGELPTVLREIAASYNEELETISGRIADLVNPIMIVVLGVLVGFIVAAILLPITDFSSLQGVEP